MSSSVSVIASFAGRTGARGRLKGRRGGSLAVSRGPPICGIIGYVGDRACKPLLLAGLERLEYRGYDSAGLSLVDGRHDVELVRAVGNLAELRAVAGTLDSTATTGIGHTRWATHGRPVRAERAPADRLRRALLGRAQRDHRELRRARGAAASPTGTVLVGDGRRGRRRT